MKIALSIIAAAALVAGAAHAAPGEDGRSRIAAAGAFDGAWTFESGVSSGSCPTLTPQSVRIAGGRVVAVNGGAAQPWGYVTSDGTLSVRLTFADGHITRASGTLRRAEGGGSWSSSTAFCGGVWRASRTTNGEARR